MFGGGASLSPSEPAALGGASLSPEAATTGATAAGEAAAVRTTRAPCLFAASFAVRLAAVKACTAFVALALAVSIARASSSPLTSFQSVSVFWVKSATRRSALSAASPNFQCPPLITSFLCLYSLGVLQLEQFLCHRIQVSLEVAAAHKI